MFCPKICGVSGHDATQLAAAAVGGMNNPEALRAAAHPLSGTAQDYDPLMELIGAARFVLLGAATHGTREFYQERGEITKRLVQEKGFTAIAAAHGSDPR